MAEYTFDTPAALAPGIRAAQSPAGTEPAPSGAALCLLIVLSAAFWAGFSVALVL